MFDARGLLRYCWLRYWLRTRSIFLDGLVGGMFLAALLDTSEKCDSKGLTAVFFYIGMAHFCSLVLVDLAEYSVEAAGADGVETRLERAVQGALPYLLHLVRLVQFPLLAALTYHVLAIQLGGAAWTHDRAEQAAAEVEMMYCEANTVHIGVITVAFQLVYGLLILATWSVLWAVDSQDDRAERAEERAWREAEARQAGSLLGHVKEFLLVVGLQSFFDEQVSGTFLALSLALPHASCNIHVTEWFLVAGAISTLTLVTNQLREEVEQLAMLDGIVNKVEHRLITFLKMVCFPLFLVELAAFLAIALLVVEHSGDIVTSKNRAGSSTNQHYCEGGIWKLMLGVIVIYSAVLVFRVVTVVASLATRSKASHRA